MGAIYFLSTTPEQFPFLTAEFIALNKYHKMFVEKWCLAHHRKHFRRHTKTTSTMVQSDLPYRNR